MLLRRMRISDGGKTTWLSELGLTVHSPLLLYQDYYFDQYVKYTNAGDTSHLVIQLLNTGSYVAENPIGRISSSDSLITIIDSLADFSTILPDSIEVK